MVRVWGGGGVAVSSFIGGGAGGGRGLGRAPAPGIGKEPLGGGAGVTGRHRADRWSGPCPCRASGLGCGPSTARSFGPC